MPQRQRRKTYRGRGVLNKLIDKLPVELHIPGYNYCGPGTRLDARIRAGIEGKNKLDSYCKEHDIAYSKGLDLASRHAADNILAQKAWKRVTSSDASLGEKAAALAVTGAMRSKIKLGAGLRTAKAELKKFRAALKKKLKKNKRRRRTIPTPRTKRGGIIPLLPIFAGLSALGALGGGAAQIANAVNSSKSNKKQLQESTRHNKTLEAIAMGKKGSGIMNSVLSGLSTLGALSTTVKKMTNMRRNTNGKGISMTPFPRGRGLYLKPYEHNTKSGKGIRLKKKL